MKNVLMLAALVLGTTTMVNAQEKPAAAKAEVTKEVKHAKHAKHAEKKAEKDAVKMEAPKAKAEATKMEAPKAKK